MGEGKQPVMLRQSSIRAAADRRVWREAGLAGRTDAGTWLRRSEIEEPCFAALGGSSLRSRRRATLEGRCQVEAASRARRGGVEGVVGRSVKEKRESWLGTRGSQRSRQRRARICGRYACGEAADGGNGVSRRASAGFECSRSACVGAGQLATWWSCPAVVPGRKAMRRLPSQSAQTSQLSIPSRLLFDHHSQLNTTSTAGPPREPSDTCIHRRLEEEKLSIFRFHSDFSSILPVSNRIELSRSGSS